MEKIAICYTAIGESYRESVVKRINESGYRGENYAYIILTDNVGYFEGKFNKFVTIYDVNKVMKHKEEIILSSVDKNDYAEQFSSTNYLFPFSIYRFLLIAAWGMDIKNVCIMCTDTKIDESVFDLSLLGERKNYVYNAVSEWDAMGSEHSMGVVWDALRVICGYEFDKRNSVRVLDHAARLFVFEYLSDLRNFFVHWDKLIKYLYDTNNMHHFNGSYVINDEYILAPLYKMYGLTDNRLHNPPRIFQVNHNIAEERFWRTAGCGLLESTNYEEFKKINNLG